MLFADVLQMRARLLAEKAVFKDAEDALPEAASVSIIYRIHDGRVADQTKGNLLGQNYWNINDAVSC